MRVHPLNPAEALVLRDRLDRRVRHASSNRQRHGNVIAAQIEPPGRNRRAQAMCALSGPPRAVRQRHYARGCTPLAFAACVAIRSMSGGDRQSYGSRPSSLILALTAPMLAGSAPDSIMDETKAANSGGDQPCSGDSSVWMKSTPYSG